MIVHVLGSGTSTGVPIIGCKCKVCRSKHPRNQRLRASIWVQDKKSSFVVDTSTDFRQQALRAKIPHLDAVLYTHPHADHIFGIDELRAFTFFRKTPLPVYGNDWTKNDLYTKFPYVFDQREVEGGAVAKLRFHEVGSDRKKFSIRGTQVKAIPVDHGSQEVLAYRIKSLAYVTDCSRIPTTSLKQLKNLDVLILDCVKLAPHRTHFNLEKALSTVESLRPKRTYLTHLGHDFDYPKWSKRGMLPPGVALAYDGLKIKLNEV